MKSSYGNIEYQETKKRVTWIPYEDVLYEALKDPEEALAYLRVSFEDEDPRIFLLALADVAKAHGGLQVLSKKTGLNRESLYRTLSLKGNPILKWVVASASPACNQSKQDIREGTQKMKDIVYS